jgi:hypothetical protein
MKIHIRILTALLIAFLFSINALAEKNLTDPYEIMNRYYEAIGGLEKVKSVQSQYFEGKVTIVGASLEGTIKHWSQSPMKSRDELDLKIFTHVSGDNGEFSWELDANGKLKINKDEETLKRRRVSALMEEYDHLDPSSKNFTLTYEGIEKIGEADCYVVKISNKISDDISRDYINTETFLIEKSVTVRPDTEEHALVSDYREVNGVLYPFKMDLEILPVGQKLTIEMTKYETDLEIDPALFEPPEEDVEDYVFSNSMSAEGIDFLYQMEHILIPITVGGKERLWLLDTGAGMTVIDSAFAVELGLKPEGQIKGSGIGNTVDVGFVKVPSFELPGLKINSQTAASINLHDLFVRTGWDAVGILGYDFLSRFTTEINYADEKISLYEPEFFDYDGWGVVLDATMRGKFLCVPMTIDGKSEGRWNFDTGAGGSSFHFPFAEENKFMDLEGVDGMAFGAGGGLKMRSTEFDEIEFAGFKLEDQVISFPLEEGVGAFSGKELVGNLGNSVFRHFTIYLDYANQQIIVEKGKDFERVFPRDKSGLQVHMTEEGGYQVIFVSPGTPADKAGFKSDDIITAINGIDLEYIDGLGSFRKLMKKEAGTDYKFSLLRDDKPKEIKMKLKDLF